MATQQTELTSSILAGKLTQEMSFAERVWAMTARVPRGKVTTYGEIAKALNCTAYRAVGLALGRNPHAPRVPCHRVVGSDGRLVGFAGGLPKKAQLLEEEGVELTNGRVDLKRFGCTLA